MNGSPTEMQLDALREVANVGCGHAANALSQLVGGQQVQIDVPRALMVDAEQLPALIGGEQSVIAASLDLLGDLSGRLLLVLPQTDAEELMALLLRQGGANQREQQRSALAEAANIIASACLNAIGELTGLRLMPSVPSLAEHPARVVAGDAVKQLGEGAAAVVVLEARFSTVADHTIRGQLLLVPARSSLKRLLERLGV